MWKTETFECGSPVPILYIHNKQDKVMPYEGSVELGLSSAKESIAKWKKINGLKSDQTPQVQLHNDKTVCETYWDPNDPFGSTGVSAPVTFCILDSKNADGHCWPGKQVGYISSSRFFLSPMQKDQFSNHLCDTELDSRIIWNFLKTFEKPDYAALSIMPLGEEIELTSASSKRPREL